MENGTLKSYSDVIKARLRRGVLIFRYSTDHEVAVRAELPGKVGVKGVDSDELYATLRQLVESGVVDEIISKNDRLSYTSAAEPKQFIQREVMYTLRKDA